MAGEADLQSDIADHCRKLGARVIKQDPAIGKQKGLPDLLILYKSRWMMLECKASEKSPFRPGQREWIDDMSKWSYAKVVYPENIDMIKRDIDEIIEEENVCQR